MEEYEACIYGMEATIDLRIKILEVYGDLTLVISRVKDDWETQDRKLIPYKEHIRKLIPYFDEISFHHIPREENKLADTLATLASMFKVKWKNEAPTIHIDHLDELAHCLAIEADLDDKPWFYDIKTFLEKQRYPVGISITDKKALIRLSSKFLLNSDVLYKRNYDYVILRCMDRHEASTIIKSIHEGCEGVHAKGPAMAKRIPQVGYYWTTMEGIYMIGMIKPKASNGDRFLLVTIDYFTKWVEAASYANVTRQVVTQFIKKEIIYRYEIPSKIITDNSSNLNNNTMKEFCEEFKIEHHNYSPYRYRTSIRTSTRATPYSLVYGLEVVLPIEIEIPSLRVIMEADLDEAEWVQSQYDQLNLIEVKRLTAICHGQLYQRCLKRAFDKKVIPREYYSR
ncbi:uncharacterized protein LOC127100828 [Lathyrus oleraceus]|uniref:uncharacterized protein LOC127100828 n=1 Tax=Pisum sativum TaxID=3888 RepID=UPI0021CF70FC|nr:uncharacterized protein LOC127100828 [Pisum sativum]